MPLARARCSACSQPLADPPHVPLPVRCVQCGFGQNVQMAGDGQPSDFESAFTPTRLQQWLATARARMAGGALGVCVGACKRCQAPLVLGPMDAVSLPCPHCREPRTGTAGDVLVDQWPEAWAKVTGGDFDLEYRLSFVDDKGVTAGCAACGLPTPPGDPSVSCARCRAVTWSVRPGGQRIQLGVRVDGERQGRPFNGVVSVVQGEGMLRADALRGASAASGQSLLGITGVGCAVVTAIVFVVICGGILAIALLR